MVVRRRKKSERLRGSQTHGWGAMKKHRGSGNKGGTGMAGTGKRSDAKKPSIWKDVKYFGKFGFKKKNIKVIFQTISIRELEDRVQGLLDRKVAKLDAGVVSLNLEDIGYNKLLSNGRATKRWSITVPYASSGAIDKIKEAGGEIKGIKPAVQETKKGKE
jgi:large subunit ribosomal protein L15